MSMVPSRAVTAGGRFIRRLHPTLCATLKLFPPVVWEGSARRLVAGCTMSSRKPRSVANPLESAITTPSERILKECHSLYVDSENGKSIINSQSLCCSRAGTNTCSSPYVTWWCSEVLVHKFVVSLTAR